MANSKEVQVKLTADSSQVKKELHSTAQAVDAVGKSAQSNSGRLKTITEALKAISSNTGSANNELKALSAAIKQLNSSVADIAMQMDRFARASANAAKNVRSLGNESQGAGKGVNSMAASMKFLAGSQIAQIADKIAGGILQIGTSSVMAAAQMRQYEIAFQTMLKSADEGAKMLEDLQKFAANTPFDVQGVVQAGQQLMAFGFKAKEVIPMLTSLGDAAAGLGMKSDGVQRLAYALGQMQTSGKLNTQDMMQLTNAGVAAWDMLAKAAGKSVMEIKELTSKGMIDSKEAVKTIVQGLNSEFGGMMDKTSQEVTGLLSNIEETVEITKAVIGKQLIEAFDIKGKLTEASSSLGEFQDYLMKCQKEGLTFTQMINNAGEGAQAFTLIAGALATVIGVTLVGALAAAIAALVTFAGLSAPILVGAAAIGTLLTSLALEWDNLTATINRAISAIKEFFGIQGENGGFGGSFAGDAPKKPEAPKVNPNLITNGGTGGKGSHHKTDEEREIDNLIKKYNKVGNTFKDLEYKAKALKVAASTLFGDGKAAKEHEAELATLDAEHDKLNSQLNAELELAQKIPNAEQRDYVIKQVQAQIDAEQELFEAKKKAADYQFAHRKDKSSSEKADSIIAQAFGTEDEMQEKKDKLKQFLTEIQDMATNNDQLQGFNDVSAGDLGEQTSFIQKMLGKTPEELEADWATKTEGFGRFVDYLGAKMAEAQALEQRNTEIGQQWADMQVSWISQIGSSMGQAVTDWITGTKTIGQAMKQMVQSLLSNAMNLLAEWLSIFAIMSIWNPPQAAAQAANKIVLGIGDMKGVKVGGYTYATGGYVAGAGTSTSDSIPAMLSNGEYVLNAQAVANLGVPYLNGLNSGKYHYATGGLVGSIGYSASEGNNLAAGNSISVNISAVDASGFGDFLARGGLDSIKQALTDDDRMFGSAVGVW